MGDQNYHDAIQRGYDALEGDDMEASASAFQDAFRLASNDRDRASAQIQIGWRLRSLGRDEAALAAFRGVAETVQAKPDEIFMAKMNIGWCLSALQDLEGALAAFRETLPLSPSPSQTAIIHSQIGFQLRAHDRGDEAVPHFCEAAEMEDAEAETRALACVQLGWDSHDRGDTVAKLKWFRKALDIGDLPKETVAECWWAIAGGLRFLGEHRNAKDALDRMLAIPEADPNFVRDAQPMLEDFERRFSDSAPTPPAAAADTREVICGMQGEISWQPILPASGLDGLAITGKWERDGDAVIVRSKDATASLSFGEESWEDYELDVYVTPLEGGNVQVELRRSYMGAYVVDYMLGIRAVQVSRARSHAFERLSVVDYPTEHDREFHLRVAARGASITTYLDGKLVNQVTDFEMKRGKIGLLAWHSVTRFRAPRYRVLSVGP